MSVRFCLWFAVHWNFFGMSEVIGLIFETRRGRRISGVVLGVVEALVQEVNSLVLCVHLVQVCGGQRGRLGQLGVSSLPEEGVGLRAVERVQAHVDTVGVAKGLLF